MILVVAVVIRLRLRLESEFDAYGSVAVAHVVFSVPDVTPILTAFFLLNVFVQGWTDCRYDETD